jgi:hypothetical protein
VPKDVGIWLRLLGFSVRLNRLSLSRVAVRPLLNLAWGDGRLLAETLRQSQRNYGLIITATVSRMQDPG